MTKSYDFEAGEIVAIVDIDHIPFTRGVYVGPIDEDTAAVKVERKYSGMGVEHVYLVNLIPESEIDAREELARAEREVRRQKLEEAGDKVRQQSAIAADALREAAKLAREAGGSLMNEFYNEVRPFLNAMDEAGWSTSSLGC